MRDQLRVGSPLCWVVAWLITLAGPAMYLLWPGALTWWVGPLFAIPVVFLAGWRREGAGLAGGHHGGGGDGAWGPPSDPGGF